MTDSNAPSIDHFFQEKHSRFKPAAVVLPLFEKDNQLHVILTKRSDDVAHHKGQICFPGGRREIKDLSLWDTAIRETEEEIGLPRNHILQVDILETIRTPTLFEIQPYVGYVPLSFSLTPCENEIAEIIIAPLSHFQNTKSLTFEEREYFGQKFSTPVFQYKGHRIWGATGRILLNFLERWH